jgi:serine protease Do
MIERVLPTVVNVRVSSIEFDPFGGAQESEGQGSGVIVDPSGIIITNNHVIEGANEVTVVFNDGRKNLMGRVLGTVPERDIAVIKVQADDLSAIEIGDSSSLRLGDEVVAIGFPLGLGGPTVTSGIVSAEDRNITVNGGPVGRLEGLLQTDAAINPGNSGGPLVDTAGRLVAINTAAAQAGSAENIGFAIPIDAALPIAQEIIDEPPEDRAWLGVQIQGVNSSAVATQLNLDPGVRGALLAGIFPDSPAEAAGLEQGDVIIDVGGRQVASDDDLTTALTRFDPGETVEVTVLRDGNEEVIDVELGQRPASIPLPEETP